MFETKLPPHAAACAETAQAIQKLRYVPIIVGPDKRPIGENWSKAERLAYKFEEHYRHNQDDNLGILLGPGRDDGPGLIDIECDGPEAAEVFDKLFPDGLPQTVSFQSPKGIHRLFQWDTRFEGLASVLKIGEDGLQTKGKHVEFRLGCKGSSQSLIPPSVTAGKARVWINDFSHPVAKLPEAVINLILASKKPRESKQSCDKTWDDILTAHGWTVVGDGKFKRPGETDKQLSASVVAAKDGTELLHVFTSSTVLEAGKNYNKFALYAALNHDGDYKAAKAALNPDEESVSVRLLAYRDEIDFFKTPGGDLYATVEVNGHKETHSLKSKKFRSYLSYRHYTQFGKTPNQAAMGEALLTYEGIAEHEGRIEEVYIRLAGVRDEHGRTTAIYLDLGTPEWNAVEITATGCRIVSDPPVKFRRPKTLLALSNPDFGGKIHALREFINLSDDDFTLLALVLASYLRDRGPFVILLLECAHGSAKTTTLKYLRRLIDNNSAKVRGKPENEFDLHLAASNSRFVVIDNISTLIEWLADALCRISTGAGLGCKVHFEQEEEKILETCVPIMVGTITNLTARADFLSRCVLLKLRPLSESNRLDEESLDAKYQAALPQILGALCQAVSHGLKTLPTVDRTHLPRMADFAVWCRAVEGGFGFEKGTFDRLYRANVATIEDTVLDTPVASALLKYVSSLKPQKGIYFDLQASDLYEKLSAIAMHGRSNEDGLPPEWPKNSRALSVALQRHVGTIPGFELSIKPKHIVLRKSA